MSDERADRSPPVYAPLGSWLGDFQRGAGAAHLALLEMPREEARGRFLEAYLEHGGACHGWTAWFDRWMADIAVGLDMPIEQLIPDLRELGLPFTAGSGERWGDRMLQLSVLDHLAAGEYPGAADARSQVFELPVGSSRPRPGPRRMPGPKPEPEGPDWGLIESEQQRDKTGALAGGEDHAERILTVGEGTAQAVGELSPEELADLCLYLKEEGELVHLPLAVRLAEEFLLGLKPWPKGWMVEFCARVEAPETATLLQRMFVECPFYGVRSPAWKGGIGQGADWVRSRNLLWSAWALGDYRVSKFADPAGEGATVRLQRLSFSPAARPQVRAIASGRVPPGQG